jgi:phosphomannomutase
VLGHSAGNAAWFGLFDFDASPSAPNQLIALLFDYLVESNQWTGGAARSVTTSHLVDRVSEARGLSAFETPGGFKYIGESINEEQSVIRGKDSAKRSIKGHFAQKDGILARVLTAPAVASCCTLLAAIK